MRVGLKWGFIDRTGKTVIPPIYDFATSFQSGLAAVKIADKRGYIDHEGNFVWAPSR